MRQLRHSKDTHGLHYFLKNGLAETWRQRLPHTGLYLAVEVQSHPNDYLWHHCLMYEKSYNTAFSFSVQEKGVISSTKDPKRH